MTRGSSMTIAAEKAHESPATHARPAELEPSFRRRQPQAAATFTFPNRILFELGRRKLLAAELARLADDATAGRDRSRADGDRDRDAWSPVRWASTPLSSATWRRTRPKTTCLPALERYRDRRL